MRASARRADEAWEGLSHAPERLALALPLTAAFGLTIVMTAAAVEPSAPIVTLAAAGGFALCAAAPLALVQVYVGRPLRVALAHLRAARDGAAPPLAAPAPGVIADLVAVARDIQAEQASVGQYRAGVALCEQMAAAGDEAIRAFRLRSEEWAETRAQSETQLRRAAQDRLTETADALAGAAPSTSLDFGIERIEQMLVYLAEMLERREPPPEAADICGLVGREAQAIRDIVAAHALAVRSDIAGAVEDGKAAQGRLEARVIDLAGPGAARLVDAIGVEAEATRAAVRDRHEETLAGAKAAPDTVARGLGEVAERLREQGEAQAGRLDKIEARLKDVGEGARENQSAALAVLAKCTDKLRNAIDRFDVLSAAAAHAQTSHADLLGAAVRALEIEVAGFGDRLARGAEGQGQTLDAVRAQMAGVATHLETLSERLARRPDALDAKSPPAGDRDLAAAQARCESLARQIAIAAAALASLAEREGRDFDALRAAVERASAKTASSTAATSQQWDETFGA